MTNPRVCILGGTGFVGHHLVTRLAASGYRCRILSRRPERHRHQRLVPNVELRQLDVSETGALRTQLEGCSAVIYLVGILNEGGGQTFQRVHVDLVERVLQAASAAGVRRYLHMSALNAHAEQGKSRYLRTKGAGENLAHSRAEMDVTSFRPSVIFGPGDGFFNRFASLLKITPGVFPLACPDARFAPVYVGDVVAALTKALADAGTVGKRYDLCGPQSTVVGLPDFAARLQARIFQLLPGKPFTMDNYLSLQVDSLCEHNALTELGIKPQLVETLVPGYLR
jgi:uncharacterized protein YbjT (DUF2867 family)